MLSFFKSSDLVLGVKKYFFCSFWLIFYPLDPDIFAHPDPGSQNLADPKDSDPGSQNLEDPTDPDPKHWFKVYCCISDMALFKCKVTRNHT